MACQSVLAGLVERLAAVADAGVGDDDVEPAELLDAVVHGGLQRVVVADVDLGGDDPPVLALDQSAVSARSSGVDAAIRSTVSICLADVDRDDVGALLGQPDRVSAALAAGRAGDERDLAVDFVPSSSTSFPRCA